MREHKTGERPAVYIVVLNWNSWKDTVSCIDSLKKITYGNYKILIVDNGSVDGSEEILKERFPELTLIQTGRNLGFAGGVNVGIKCALKEGADYILLLNNDTVVAPDFLDELVKVAERDERAGILCSKIYFYSEPDRIWYAGASFYSWIGFTVLRGCRRKDTGQFDTIEETEPTGCAMLLKRELCEKIGFFNEDYFCYYEDLEFGMRARRAGFKTLYVPSSKLWHKVGETTKGSLAMLYYMMRNSLDFIDTYYPLPAVMRYIRYMLVAGMFSFYVLVTQGQRFKGMKRIYQGVRDYFNGRFGEFKQD